MKIMSNEGVIDRIMRVAIAEIFFLLAFFWLAGVWQIVFYVLAVAVLATAVSGFCGLYKILGVSTSSIGENSLLKRSLGFLIMILVAVVGSYYSNFLPRKYFWRITTR